MRRLDAVGEALAVNLLCVSCTRQLLLVGDSGVPSRLQKLHRHPSSLPVTPKRLAHHGRESSRTFNLRYFQTNPRQKREASRARPSPVDLLKIPRRAQFTQVSAVSSTASDAAEVASASSLTGSSQPLSDTTQDGQSPFLKPKSPLSCLDRNDLIRVLNQYYTENDDILRHFEEGKPDMLIHAFLGPEKYRKRIYSLPGATFAEAFRMISPNYFIEPYKRLQRYFHPAILSGKGFKSLQRIFQNFKDMLNSIAKQRVAAGHSLGLVEYTHLLWCASSMGDEAMARNVWEAMLETGIEPTTECYNFYMASHVWHGAFFSKEKFNLRLTQWNYTNRAAENQAPGYRGVRTGYGGTRDIIFEIFKDMTARGVQTNETTFVHLMAGACREGDIESVKKILKTVWNIDVNALREYGEGPHLVPVTKYSTSSPLHPTDQLFFCVAHVFGSNNDILMGLQLADYISRHYNIYISQAAWQELFEWSFVLSQKRFKERARENSVGYVSPHLVDDIFRTMTAEPYNAYPNMVIRNLVAKHAFIRQNLKKMISQLRMGYETFMRSIERRNRVSRTLVTRQLIVASSPPTQENRKRKERLEDKRQRERMPPLNAETNHQPQSTLTPDHFETSHLTLSKIKAFRTMNDVLLLKNLEVARDATLIERWIRLVMIGRGWMYDKARWELQVLPEFIEEWRPFMPRRPLYFCTAGLIVFEERGIWKGGKRLRPEVALRPLDRDQLKERRKGVDWVVWGVWEPLGRWR